MAARRPNILNAVIDMAFAIGCAACGAFGLGPHFALGVVLAHAVYWFVSKQNSLRATPRNQLLPVIAVSLAMIAIIDLGAYWIATLITPAAGPT